MENPEISEGLTENELADSCEIGVNGAGTCEQNDTKLTQCRSSDVPEFTYFIRDAEGIKIGRSIDPRGRMHNLQAGNGSKLKLLVAVPRARISEPEAHKKFRHLKTHREWFRPEQDLLDFIEVLKAETIKPRRVGRPKAHGKLIGDLNAVRRAHGANTPMGHACSNVVEQISHMANYVRPAWASHKTQTLPWMIEQQMKRIETLKALNN
jgi:hypothetical protein